MRRESPILSHHDVIGVAQTPAGHQVGVLVEPLDQMLERRRKALELIQVQGRKPLQPAFAVRRQHDAHDTTVRVGLRPGDEAARLGPVDELDRAVRAEQQIVGDLAHGRPTPIIVTLDRQHQLVLGGAEADLTRLPLAPLLEATEIRTKGEQARKLAAGKSGHP